MKILMIECNADELKANRGLMDAIVDACQGFMSGFYGSCNPVFTNEEDETETEDEE